MFFLFKYPTDVQIRLNTFLYIIIAIYKYLPHLGAVHNAVGPHFC